MLFRSPTSKLAAQLIVIARQTNVWQRSDLETGGNRQVAQLEPVPVDRLRENLKYYWELDAVYREFMSRKPPSYALQIFYEDVFSSDLGKNREALRSIFRFVGLGMPQSGNRPLSGAIAPQDRTLGAGERRAPSTELA